MKNDNLEIVLIDDKRSTCEGLIQCHTEWKSQLTPYSDYSLRDEIVIGKNRSAGVFEYWTPMDLIVLKPIDTIVDYELIKFKTYFDMPSGEFYNIISNGMLRNIDSGQIYELNDSEFKVFLDIEGREVVASLYNYNKYSCKSVNATSVRNFITYWNKNIYDNIFDFSSAKFFEDDDINHNELNFKCVNDSTDEVNNDVLLGKIIKSYISDNELKCEVSDIFKFIKSKEFKQLQRESLI